MAIVAVDGQFMKNLKQLHKLIEPGIELDKVFDSGIDVHYGFRGECYSLGTFRQHPFDVGHLSFVEQIVAKKVG